MKSIKFSWQIWLMAFLIIVALAVSGWLSAQYDIQEWAKILIDLIITIIGVFLGYWTALKQDRFNENKKNLETKKNYILSLSRDIKKIKENLNSAIQKDTTGTIVLQSLQGKYYYFELPIWEAMVSSGEVNLFYDEAFFDDICELSAKIKTLNNIENNVMIAKLVNTKINIDKIIEQKLNEIDNLCDKIDIILTNKINNKV